MKKEIILSPPRGIFLATYLISEVNNMSLYVRGSAVFVSCIMCLFNVLQFLDESLYRQGLRLWNRVTDSNLAADYR